MAEPLRLFILAGEPSGDELGADLVRRLRRQTSVQLSGVGGPALIGEGLNSLFSMNDLAVMGWVDVLPRLPLLLWRARQVAQAILKAAPDVVVFVDAQVFSKTVASQVRRGGGTMPILLYVAPAVWAYGPERAKALNGRFDEVMGILPFEPKVMAELGGPPTSFVGHVAVERYAPRETVPEKGPLLLLPGSRRGELRRHLPLLREVGTALANHPRVTHLVIPTISAVERVVLNTVAQWPVVPNVITGAEARRTAFSDAVAACAVMGTITLELAVASVPTVGTYIGDAGQVKRVLDYKIRHVSLPNLILGRALIPEELYSAPPKPDALIQQVRTLLDDPAKAAAQLAGFREIRAVMESGLPDAPRVDPAERVLAHVRG
jgi:lipid-A-disaccharide synthase